MKYRKKPVIVEAEVYEPGMEDGFAPTAGTDLPGWKPRMVPYIMTPRGRRFINALNYIIVTDESGSREVYNPFEFAYKFEPVKEEDRATL